MRIDYSLNYQSILFLIEICQNFSLRFSCLFSLSVSPSITRSEIDALWSRCHLKENGKLDFYQFLREFGYTKGSAHYPNAKSHPPRRGDADFLLTSRKLYGDSVLVHGTTLNAIRSNWNELRREFVQLDPFRTGFIQSEEFDEILTELCPIINQEDLQTFKHKFQTKADSRLNRKKHTSDQFWIETRIILNSLVFIQNLSPGFLLSFSFVCLSVYLE